jgi:carbohydrate-selective porin OprB
MIYNYQGNGIIFKLSSLEESIVYSYTNSGTGDAHLNGSASTKLELDYSYSGVDSITLSGELVHPDIQFIPTPK